MATVSAVAPLSALPSLGASAGTQPGLWFVYQVAALRAGDLWQQWRMMRSVAATDGTAGQLYGQAYSAQQVADTAYQAFLDSQQAAFGRRG